MALEPSKKTCNILGSEISVLSCHEVAKLFIDWHWDRPQYVCISNVHTVVEGWRDPTFCHVTNSGLMATADGVPLLWAAKWFHFLSPQTFPAIHGRASGPDVLAEVLDLDHQRTLRHAFYGSTPDTLNKMQANILRRWPGTQIVSAISPPFRSLSDQEQSALISEMNHPEPHLIWVGLGAPKQEKWMANHFAKFEAGLKKTAPLLVGVGAAFDFFAETKPRAPLWMQKMGLEWFFRLCSEPRRLFRRYAVTNSFFVFGVMKQTVKILKEKSLGSKSH